MPTQWSLTLTPPPLPGVLPAHLHALGCALLESPTENHNAQTKPFTTALSRQRLTLGCLEEGTEPDLPSRLPARTSHRAQRAFTALWLFAAFAGVGAQITHGLGHVRVRVDEEAPTGTRPSPAMTARIS